MKKFLVSAVAAATLMAAAIPAANAATVVSNTFTVSVAINSVCTVTTQPGNIAFGTYTAITGSALTASTSVAIGCTRGFSANPVVTFDTTNGLASGEGVLNGLLYTLTPAAAVVSAGTAATTGTVGTADTYTYAINGNIAAGQAGTCTGTTCAAASHTRTITFTY